MLHRCILLLIALIISLPSFARQSCEWPFRTQIDVQENSTSGNQLQSYQVQFDIDASTLSSEYDWSSNGQDLYIYDTDDQTQLEFWIDSWDQANEQATLWVRFPTLDRGQIRTIYFYYGNENAPAAGDVPFTFDYPGIKFHTRFSTVNPSNLTQARNAFNASNDLNSNYGCGFITNFSGITNRSQFGNSNSNFGAFSESYFLVQPGETGQWGFRYGADFGRGGALYINGVQLEQQWGDNLWWANSWTNASQVLQGTATFSSSGYQKLEVLGFEDCCDGGITVQFKKPNGNWTTFATNNIDIRSRACPIEQEPTFQSISHDVCRIDLGFDSSLSYPNAWVVDDSRPVTFAIENLSTTHPSLPQTRVAISLSAGLSLSSSSGSNWTCTSDSGTPTENVECLYGLAISPNGASSNPVTLNIMAANTNTSATFNATVFSKQFEELFVNNQTSANLPIWQLLDDINPTCTTPQQGVYTGVYDTQGYGDNYANSEAEFDQWENDLAIRSKLDGKTILNRINSSSGNPFDVRNNDYYLVLIEGYLYAPEDGFYNVAVDGDDAVELKLNDVVYSSWYGAHGAQNSPHDENTVGLAEGYHKLNYRMQEYLGGDSFYAYWRLPNDSVTRIIPETALFHCAGDDDIRLNINIDIQDNPNTISVNDKAIPNAVLRYNVAVTNEGNVSTLGSNPIELIQTLSDDAELFVNNLSADGPVLFNDAAGNDTSGLSYNFISLASTTDDLSFSNDNGVSFNYIPVPDGDGYDSAVTHIKLLFTGSMKPKYSLGTPKFDIEYQVKIK